MRLKLKLNYSIFYIDRAILDLFNKQKSNKIKFKSNYSTSFFNFVKGYLILISLSWHKLIFKQYYKEFRNIFYIISNFFQIIQYQYILKEEALGKILIKNFSIIF